MHQEVAVAVHNLRLRYVTDEQLLFEDVSLTIHRGEKVLFLGPSGCGKSTLLNVLAGLIPDVIQVPMKVDQQVKPEQSGIVFQDPEAQFCMSYVDEEIAFVLENLQVPRAEMDQRIRSLLELVGLQLNEIHTPIAKLSGGMKQRLALAAVLALEPDVLFFDEPTSLIDEEGTFDIWQTVKRLAAERTVIVVEHKLDYVLDFIDRIVLFDERGTMIADGDKVAILQQYESWIHEQGIWHPTVWQRYLQTAQFRKQVAHQPRYELRNAVFYRQKQPMLTVEQLSLASGEWVAVTGANGAGKSTFLQGLFNFVKATGDVTLDGIPVAKCHDLPEKVAFVFQNPELQFVTNSVYDELAYGPRIHQMTDVVERVDRALATYYLTAKRDHHPYELSIGQKRRLSVASSTLLDQMVFLLDEPTFGQDAKNTFALLERLEVLRQQGALIIMVTHDRHIVQQCATREIVISDGQIAYDRQLERNDAYVGV